MDSERFGLTEPQWECIKRGPLNVFALVAVSDSYSDRNEWAAFRAAAYGANGHAEPVFRAAMAAIAEDFEGLPRDLAQRDAAIEGLREIQAVASLLPDGGEPFRTALMELGRAIADASGAQLTRNIATGNAATSWRHSPGTSAMEREALALAAEALGVQ